MNPSAKPTLLHLVASGSDFRPASPGRAYNFLEPYLRAVLGFIGIADAQFVYAHSFAAGESASTQAVAEAQTALDQLARQQAA